MTAMTAATSPRRTLALLLAGVALVACRRAGPAPERPDGPGRGGRAHPGRTLRPRLPVSPTAPASTDTTGFLAAVAAMPAAQFKVTYAVSGYPGVTKATVWWAQPLSRLDSAYAGYPFRVYTDVSTGKVTICVTLLGQTACDSDVASEIAVLYESIKAMVPTSMAERAKSLAAAPGVAGAARTIAGQPAVCMESAAQQICLASSGAVLYAGGVVTMAVNGGPSAALTFEATEYRNGVSEGEVRP